MPTSPRTRPDDASPPSPPPDSYPLTPTQEGLIFNSLRGGTGLVEIEQIVMRLRHPLDVGLLWDTWQWAVARHEVLRTAFRWDDGHPRQLVFAEVALPRQERRHARLPEEARESALARFLEEDRAHGFDLTKAPLCRLTLFEHAPDHHVLVWTFHHALLDGRSFTQVLREVFSRYDATLRGETFDPPAPPPFRIHCEYLASRDTRRDEAFWSTHLRGLPGPTPVPTARAAREGAGRRRHDEVEAQVGAATVDRLIELGREHGFTLANAVQAAWAIALARYAHTDDVCFGVTRAARHTSVPEAQQMVGCLINTVPLRVTLPQGLETLELLRQLREINVAVRPHEQASLASMRRWAGLPAGSSLFQTIVVFERYTMNSELRSAGGPWLDRHFSVLEQSDFPLLLAAYQDEHELTLRLEHDPVTCEHDSVVRLAAQVVTLLRAIAQNPLASVDTLPMLDDAEREELLALASGDERLAPCAHPTWPLAFAAQAERTPDAIALVSPEGTRTYAELLRDATLVGARLAEAGIRPGDVVAVCAPRSRWLAAALVGVLRYGAVYLPIDPAWPQERVEMVLTDADARLTLTTTAVADRLAGVEWVALDAPAAPPRAHSPAAELPAHAPAYLLYTSGSTGRPKGVLVSHRALLAHGRAIVPAFALRATDRCLQFTSPSFDVSLEEMLPTWLAGGAVVLRTDAAATSIERFVEQVREHSITVLNLPSAFFTELALDLRDHGRALPRSVRLVVVGGEKPSAAAYAAFRALHADVRFLNAYGPTEVTVTSTFADPVASDVPADGQTELPIGRPLGACRAYVVTATSELAPRGVPGELWLAGPQVALGYYGHRELTEERFGLDPFVPDGERVYRTGDLVRWLPNGLLEFCGRVDDQLKIRGFRIEPGEIEAVLRADRRIREAIVGARTGRNGEQRLVAWFLPDDPSAPPGDDTLRAVCATSLPPYMVPSAFVALTSVPITPSGKVDKRALPDPGVVEPVAVVAPSGATETWLAEQFQQLLGLEHVGRDTNFFEHGGHSLLAVRLLSRINTRSTTPLELGAIFSAPTIADLARVIDSGGGVDMPTVVALNHADPSSLPLFCICGVQLYAQLARAMEGDRRVYGVFLPAEADALSGQPERLDVRQMATAYIELVQQRQPRGPYLLGGISFGGILAYEMAQQLSARGETVALVALFDAILPRALHKPSPIERAREHLRRFRGDPRAFGAHLQERFLRHVARVAGPQTLARSEQRAIASVDLLRDELFRSAAETYDRVVVPYEGNVVLFRARDGLGHPGERVEWDLGWSGLIPDPSPVHVVRGNHLSILAAPGVLEIARILRTQLREVDEQPTMRRTRRASSAHHSAPPPRAETAPREPL